MGAQHTPGPWLVFDLMGGGDFHWIVTPRQQEIPLAKVEAFAPEADDMEAEALANARLIAAAPEVVEAASRLLATAELLTFAKKTAATRALPEDMAALRKAIAKAKGGAA